jgi:hypothetical protein
MSKILSLLLETTWCHCGQLVILTDALASNFWLRSVPAAETFFF